jgi:phosphoglycolate phosphatase-like HAD superfamily hydrolase
MFFSVFEKDSMWDENSGIKELGREYLTISLYFLIRHLRLNYVIGDAEKDMIRTFFHEFYERWNRGDQDDIDIERFSNKRQQSRNDLYERDIIFRQHFFDHLTKAGKKLLTFDKKRAFNEAEKILIYRRDNGLCQHCLKEGKPEGETQVSWTEYQADHIFAHALGGETVGENAQVLCKYHNAKKGAKLEIPSA